MAALASGDCAVDIGAHKGGYLYWLQKHVGPLGRVFAFEPQSDLAEYLRRTMGVIGARHVIVKNLALSERAGTATLHPRRGRSSCGATLEVRIPPSELLSRPVRLTTLDDSFQDCPVRAHALKCDVERHELAVFRSAARILRDHRPTLLFECEARHQPGRSVLDVFQYLSDFGYEGWFFLRGRQIPVAEFHGGMQRIPKSRAYVNNFLFRPEEKRSR